MVFVVVVAAVVVGVSADLALSYSLSDFCPQALRCRQPRPAREVARPRRRAEVTQPQLPETTAKPEWPGEQARSVVEAEAAPVVEAEEREVRPVATAGMAVTGAPGLTVC